MDTEIKKIWQNALLSGKYKQGTQCLRNANNEFCCLGVLADIYIQKHDSIKWIQEISDDNKAACLNGKYYISGLPLSDGIWSYLPEEIAMWCGLKDGNPDITTNDEKINLAYMNDNGASFIEIAEMINRL